MACASIITLPRTCGSTGFLQAGVKELYMIAYGDLINVGTSSQVYTLTNNIVTAIGITAGKGFVKIGILKETAGINEKLTKNPNGTGFITQTGTVKLVDINVANQTFIDSVANQPVAYIVKMNTDAYVVAGLNGLCELGDLEGGTGVASGDDLGYALSFVGTDKMTVRTVDPSIISTIVK